MYKQRKRSMSANPVQILRLRASTVAAMLLAITVLAGCGSSNNSATGDSASQSEPSAKSTVEQSSDRVPDQPAAQETGIFKATISGAVEGKIAWTDVTATRHINRLTIMIEGGDDGGDGAMAKLAISMPGKGHQAPVGTYPLKIHMPNDPADPNDLAIMSFHPAGSDPMLPVQVSTLLGGSGEVVITRSSPEEVSGTFHFTGSFMDHKAFKQREATVKGSFHAPGR